MNPFRCKQYTSVFLIDILSISIYLSGQYVNRIHSMKKFDFSVIRNLRKKSGLTSVELANSANLTRCTVANLEGGRQACRECKTR